MGYAKNRKGDVIYRTTEITVPVQEVKAGDLLFDIPVVYSEPQTDWIWMVDARDEENDKGIQLLMTKDEPVKVKRSLPLEENQCIDCGRQGVKYAARHQCNACYQRDHRQKTARSKQAPEQLRLIG